MGMGQGHPQGGHREGREGDDVVPGSGETLEDEIEVPSGCRGEDLPSEEGPADGPEAEPRAGHAGGHIGEEDWGRDGGRVVEGQLQEHRTKVLVVGGV